MFKVFENDEYTVLNFRSLKMKDVIKFCKVMNKLYRDGYEIDENPTVKQCPKIPQIFNLRFVKTQDIQQEETVKEEIKNLELEDLNKLEELRVFAKSNNIEIPEDITHRLQIKKYLKDQLAGDTPDISDTE